MNFLYQYIDLSGILLSYEFGVLLSTVVSSNLIVTDVQILRSN